MIKPRPKKNFFRSSRQLFILLFIGLYTVVSCTKSVDPNNDNTPDAFNFENLENQEVSSEVISNEITITGISNAVEISISGDSTAIILINNQESETKASVKRGDLVKIKTQTPNEFETSKTINILIGTISEDWTITSKSEPEDKEPSNLNFASIDDAELSTIINSEIISLEGINTTVDVKISGDDTAKFIINGTEYSTTDTATAENGDAISLKIISSDDYQQVSTITITVGTATTTWTIITKAALVVPINDTASLQVTLSADQVKDAIDIALDAASASILKAKVTNGVKVYKLEYDTAYINQKITQSALLCIPDMANDSSGKNILSIQHSTITKHGDEPSNTVNKVQQSFSSGSLGLSEGVISILLSSFGYVTIAPDYVGFGSSEDFIHPYLIKKPAQISVAKGIEALESFASKQNLTLSTKFSLIGYSEGAYVSVSAQQYLETTPVGNITLDSTYVGAGPFGLIQIAMNILENTTYSEPFFFAYTTESYRNYYSDYPDGLNKSIYKEPYLTNLETKNLFDGSKDSDEINAELSENNSALYTDVFVADIDTDDNFEYIRDILRKNSITDWDIKSKLFLYHSRNDDLVTYKSTEKLNESLNNPSLVTYHEQDLQQEHGASGGTFFRILLTDVF